MKLPSWPNPKGYRDIDLNLSRIRSLLQRLDNPQNRLPKTIHVAGTNGKGSTIAFLRAFLEAHQKTCHIYTSPHLVEFNERIILAGTQISDDFLNQCLEKCRLACEIKPKITPTYFEGITAAAFLAFSLVEADFLLLETGMGGRFDATNVLDEVLCSVLTPISLDHTEFLGDTIAKIAYEKCGIFKKNTPIFIAKQTPEALKIIKEEASKLNCPLYIFGQDFNYEIKENHWQITPSNFQLPFIDNLAGKHQMDNATLALSLIITQNLVNVKQNRIKSAIPSIYWPARLQKITSGHFFNPSQTLFLDGSHNQAGAKTILEFLQNNPKKPHILVFSMLKDKNCQKFLEIIADEIDQLIAIPIENEKNSRNPGEIVEIAKKIGINACKSNNLEEAFAKITKKDPLILVCGSLYLAGNFIAQNYEN